MCQGSLTLSNPSVHTACHALESERYILIRTTVIVPIIQFWELYMFITVHEIVVMLATLNPDGKCDHKGHEMN